MSASSTPTRSPIAARPSARLAAVVDLPTPPLPDATAMIAFTPGTSGCCAWGLAPNAGGGPAGGGCGRPPPPRAPPARSTAGPGTTPPTRLPAPPPGPPGRPFPAPPAAPRRRLDPARLAGAALERNPDIPPLNAPPGAHPEAAPAPPALGVRHAARRAQPRLGRHRGRGRPAAPLTH